MKSNLSTPNQGNESRFAGLKERFAKAARSKLAQLSLGAAALAAPMQAEAAEPRYTGIEDVDYYGVDITQTELPGDQGHIFPAPNLTYTSVNRGAAHKFSFGLGLDAIDGFQSVDLGYSPQIGLFNGYGHTGPYGKVGYARLTKEATAEEINAASESGIELEEMPKHAFLSKIGWMISGTWDKRYRIFALLGTNIMLDDKKDVHFGGYEFGVGFAFHIDDTMSPDLRD